MFSSLAKQFILKETGGIVVPGIAPGNLRIPHPEEVVAFLDLFLQYDVSHDAVRGVGDKIREAIERLVSRPLNKQRLTSSLLDLATAFEPYLKKLGLTKYSSDSVRQHGSTEYVGISELTLGKLLEGKLKKKPNCTGPDISIPLVTFSYTPQTPAEYAYNRCRDVRNLIHEARDFSIAEASEHLKYVLASYCLSLAENLALRQTVDPVFRYMARAKLDLQDSLQSYINNVANEVSDGSSLPDVALVEWGRANDLLAIDQIEKKQSLTGTILELAEQRECFWLVGEPGSGKTTSLRKLVTHRSEENLRVGYIAHAIPCVVPASLHSKGYSLEQCLCDLLLIERQRVEQLLDDGDILLVIDGFNEVTRKHQRAIQLEVARLRHKHNELPFIVATRKHALPTDVQDSVMEIQPFTPADIRNYLISATDSRVSAERLYTALSSDQAMMQLAKNPLFLRMISRVATNGELPRDRAELFRRFTGLFFERERPRLQHPVDFYEHALSEMAVRARQTAIARLSRGEAVAAIQDSQRDANALGSVYSIFDELFSTRLILSDSKGNVKFAHELFLEFYAANALHRLHLAGDDVLAGRASHSEWHEAIRLFVSLLANPSDVLNSIVHYDLPLAARCARAVAITDLSVERRFIDECQKAIDNRKTNSTAATSAMTALLELRSKYSLKLAVKSPVDKHLSLHRAIQNCERPEEAALALLRFGSTGQTRAFACLKAFDGQPVSPQFLASEEVARAQCILIRRPLVVRHLRLIAAIGVASPAVSQIESVFIKELTTTQISSAVLAGIARVAGRGGMKLGDTKILRDVIDGSLDIADRAYRAVIVCEHLQEHVDLHLLAFEYAKLCFANGLVVLGCRLAACSHVWQRFTAAEIVDMASNCVAGGRPGQLVSLINAFRDTDLSSYIATSIKIASDEGNADSFIVLAEKFNHSEDELIELACQTLLNRSVKQFSSRKFLRRFVGRFNLQARLADVWCITTVFEDKRFGFARNVVTGDSAFFHQSAFRTLSFKRDSLLGRFVTGEVSHEPDAQVKSALRAVRVL